MNIIEAKIPRPISAEQINEISDRNIIDQAVFIPRALGRGHFTVKGLKLGHDDRWRALLIHETEKCQNGWILASNIEPVVGSGWNRERYAA